MILASDRLRNNEINYIVIAVYKLHVNNKRGKSLMDHRLLQLFHIFYIALLSIPEYLSS